MTLTLARLARRAVGLTAIALFGVLLVFTLFTHLTPMTGRQLFIVGGGSMEPSIPLGSLVIATAIDPMTIAPGDVVTIRADNGVVVTHRVRSVVDLADGRFFELRGDANTSSDAVLVPARAIVGLVDRHIPYAGIAQQYLATAPGLLSVVGILGGLYLIHVLLAAPARSIARIPETAPSVVRR